MWVVAVRRQMNSALASSALDHPATSLCGTSGCPSDGAGAAAGNGEGGPGPRPFRAGNEYEVPRSHSVVEPLARHACLLAATASRRARDQVPRPAPRLSMS